MSAFGSLSTEQVKQHLKEEVANVEAWLRVCLNNSAIPAGLKASMAYSLTAGGKRIRPVLCLVSAKMHGLTSEAVMPFAGALECIHTYSLIHDDLPAMDDDDLRRGKPSNHKQFDEATAILAGDALLTDAFAFMASVPEHAPAILPQRVLAAIRLVAEAAGSRGMVGGQFLDMQYTADPSTTLTQLAAMHAMKTGALFCVPAVAGAALAGASAVQQQAVIEYGTALGAAFQIMDDILDAIGTEGELGKPVGSDAANHKITYPSLMGLRASKELALEKATQAAAALALYSGHESELLRGLAGYVINRVS